jgi:putative glutathione S-transferase
MSNDSNIANIGLDVTSKDGHFRRQTSTFRDFITPDGLFKPEKGRYVLYVNYGCPWANRTLIVRLLKKLEDFIEVSYLDASRVENGSWFYSGKDGSDEKDPVYGFKFIKEIYHKVQPDYSLRYTIPVLFDRKTETIVNNESSEIIRMFNDFNPKDDTPDLYPEPLRAEIDEINDWVYHTVNNGVYKSGFATTQEAYNANVIPLFQSLDRLEGILSGNGDKTKERDFLVGPGRGVLTEADVRLYTTIARFDVAYFHAFRCNLKSIEAGYPNIQRWFLGLYHRPEFKSVTKLKSIKEGYFRITRRAVDQETVVPIGPIISWE